jgi:hypothetical protein
MPVPSVPPEAQMSPVNLTTLLAAGADAESLRTQDCPDEHLIAGYVDGTLDTESCRALEEHVGGCGHCIALVGLLGRERRTDAIEPVPDEIVAQACALVTKERPRTWRLAPHWAAAAALVLAVPLLIQLGRVDRGVEGQGRPEPPATRTLVPSTSPLRVLSPGAGAVVDAGQLSFRWSEVQGSPFYDVRIVTDAGDIVVRQRVTGTSWRPPAQLELRRGAEYFVHIDAYPSGEKALGSDHVPFRVAD